MIAFAALPCYARGQDSRTVNATVVSVVAGDLLIVDVPSDTPEDKQPSLTIRLVEVTAPRDAQPMADEALALTRSLLPEGSAVRVQLFGDLKKKQTSDTPIPAAVETDDGTDVATELALEGLAWWDWRDAELTPKGHSEMLAVVEVEARLAGSGMFSTTHPIIPFNYQRGARVGSCRRLASVVVDGKNEPALQSSNCVIVAIVPNPRGADTGRESIVLGNRTQEKLSLDGWILHDDDGGTFPLSGSIDAGATQSVVLDEKLQLSNTGDTVWLTSPTKRIAHAAQYYSARSGQFVAVP